MDYAPAFIPISAFFVFIGSVTRIYDDRIERQKRRRIVLLNCTLCVVADALGVAVSRSPFDLLFLAVLVIVLAVEYELISRMIIK